MTFGSKLKSILARKL
jgi:hypothetical protein